MSLSRYTLFALATLYIICACEKIEPEKEGSNKDKSEEQIPGDPTPTIVEDTTKVSKDSEFPEPWTLWNGHVVIYRENIDEDTVTIVLLSRDEDNRYSAANTERPNDAWIYANSYSESGITGWELPDISIAKHLRDSCNIDTHLNEVNLFFAQTIVPKNDNGTGNTRYLCYSDYNTLNANKTFAFVANSDIVSAGKSSKYRVRLVKWITLTKEK